MKSGEVRFTGARRVENLYTYSQDLSNAIWSTTGCTKQTDVIMAPDGTMTGDRLRSNATTRVFMEFYQDRNVVSGKKYMYSVHVKYDNWRYIQII